MGTGRFIDSDSHVIEPADLWVRYLEERYRDQMPVHRTGYFDSDTGLEFRNDVTIGDCRMPVGTHGMGVKTPGLGEAYDEYVRQGFPSSAYLEAMDDAGIDYMALYPTAVLYVYHAPDLDADVAAACSRAYNSWLHDFCAEGKGRLIGVGSLALHDPDLAAKEARRCVDELGFRGVTINPTPVAGRALHDPAYEPLWATIAELGVPLGIHVGGLNACDSMLYDYLPNLKAAQGVTSFSVGNMLASAALILSGVLERHPTLRVAHLESGAGWPAFWLYRMGAGVQGGMKGIDLPGLSMHPIEYFQRQCFISADPDDPGIKQVIDVLGDDNIVVASDFGHPEGRHYRRAAEEIARLPGVTEASKAKIMWDNARRLYALEVN